MKDKILWSSILPAGFAIFSMLFGSGNIMFPINTGRLTMDQFGYGTIGFLLTGVLMPLVGLLGIVLSKGNTRLYFKELPYPIYFVLISFLLAILGPFYVIPRCIHTVYGGIIQFLPLPFHIFSGLFCACLLVMSYDHGKVVGIIGKFISPFKIGGLLCIAFTCLMLAPSISTVSGLTYLEAFTQGTQQGFQTMDLPAAIFFSAAVYHYLAKFIDTKTPKGRHQLLKNAAIACLIGEGLITIVYLCFIKLGASYAPILQDLSPEMFFPFLTKSALGASAVLLIAFTLFFSCLATSLILVDLYTSYIEQDIFNGKLPRIWALIVTLGISFAVSLTGCTRLCDFFMPILSYVYPALVVFALYKIIWIWRKTQIPQEAVDI